MRLQSFFLLLAIPNLISSGQDHSVSLGDQPYSSLKVDGNIHVRLVNSGEESLTVLSGSDPASLEWTLDNGLLLLRTGTELTQEKAVEVRLGYNRIYSMEVNRGGRLQSADVFPGPALELDVLNGGKVELRVDLDSVNARVNQGADIILSGSTRIQVVEAYTWGNYLAVDLESREAEVSAASGAQVKVKSTDRLRARATSGGVVAYAGDPGKKDLKTSLGGEIRPQTP